MKWNSVSSSDEAFVIEKTWRVGKGWRTLDVPKEVKCVGSVLFTWAPPLKPAQNTPASRLLRAFIHSDGNELLSLIVYNHTAPQSNGSLIKSSNRISCQFLSRAITYLFLFRKSKRRKPSSSSTTIQLKPSYKPLCKYRSFNGGDQFSQIILDLQWYRN